MMSQTLGDLLTEISQTPGLHRIVAVTIYADTVVNTLNKVLAEESGKTGQSCLRITDLTEAQSAVLLQILFYDWRRRDPKCENQEELERWCRLLAQNPELLDIPGLHEDIERLCQRLAKYFLEIDPEKAKEIAAELAPGYPPEDTFSLFWLGAEVPSFPVPPGHSLWRGLAVRDKGQWDKLSEDERLRRIIRLCGNSDRLEMWTRILFQLACRALERGREKSVSDERTIPLEAPVDDPRWRGLQAYQINEETREAHVDLPDPTSDRFLLELEAREEAEEELDRLAAQLELTQGEQIVYEALRQGKEGTDLLFYAQERGIAPASVPVLRSRLLSKFRAAKNPSTK